VAQILNRTADVLGPYQPQVQITTYHAFAWSLIQRFGSAIGMPDPVLASESEVRLLGPRGAVRYQDLVPLALRLCALPAMAAHLQSRWSLIVCDEFQDTDDAQYRLLTADCGPRPGPAAAARRSEPVHLREPTRGSRRTARAARRCACAPQHPRDRAAGSIAP
jgi:UvrD/REP helicase N-terminal domain